MTIIVTTGTYLFFEVDIFLQGGFIKVKIIIYALLLLSISIPLFAQVRYVRNIPIQIPDWAFTPKYAPKQIYPSPDGGVIILGDCEVGWGNPDFPNYAADCGAIKLDADGNCLWQWWSRNFVGSGPPRIVGIDQEADGRINFLINNSPDYNQIGWIDPQQNSSLQSVQWNTTRSFGLHRAMRLSDNTTFAIGKIGTLPYSSAFFMHLNAQGDTLSTRIYPPDSLWIYPVSKRGEAHDMELDTDGMPVITCTFTDMSGTVLKTDWNGNIIWRRDTDIPCAYNSFAISKVPLTNQLIIGYPVYNDFRYDYFVVYQLTSNEIDSLFSISSINYTSGFLSMICHDQGLYLAGASQFAEVSIVNYTLSGYCEWEWTGQGNDWQKGTERISILPDSSIVYVYGGDDFGSFVFITKLNSNGTANIDNIVTKPIAQLEVYPNPVVVDLHITIRIEQNTKALNKTLCVYNCKGQLVKTIKTEVKSGNLLTGVWDVTDSKGIRCASGMYIIRYHDGLTNINKKVIVIR